MQPFDETARVEAHTAKQDKIKIILGDWRLVGQGAETEQMFLNRLSDLHVPLDENPEELTWFRSRQVNRGSFITFSSRGQSRQNRPGTSLIAGEVRIRRQWNADETGYVNRITATLFINPTRFARYHAVRVRSDLFEGNSSPELDELLVSSPTVISDPLTGEVALDGRDNVLLTRRSRAVTSSQYWPDLIRYYWENIQRFLEVSFEGACDRTMTIHRAFNWEFNLQTVETYWEFQHDDAVNAIASIRNSLRAFGSENFEDTFPMHVEGRDGNAPCYTFQITKPVQAIVYAKTNKRVRLEIRHRLFGEDGDDGVIGGRHTSIDPEQLYDWLNMCAENAATRGNQILGYITANEWERVSQRPLYTFLARIVDACEDQSQYDLVLSLLINNGAIHLRQHDPLGEVVRRLARQDVLQRTLPYTQSFSVHPQYRHALEHLQTGP